MTFKIGESTPEKIHDGIVVHVSPGVLEVEKQIVLEAINWAVRMINAKLSMEVQPLGMTLLYRNNRLLLDENIDRMFINQKDGETLKYQILITPKSALDPAWLSYGKDKTGCIISTATPRTYGYTQGVAGTEFLERLSLHEIGHMFGANHCAKDSCVMEQAPGNFRAFAREHKIDNPKPFCRDCWDLMNKAPVPKKFVIPKPIFKVNGIYRYR